MANASGDYPQFLTMRHKRHMTNVTASRTLSEDNSGALIRLNIASGATVTLPTTPTPGTFFDFVVETTVTSNSYKVITGSAGELLVGSILNCDTDSADAVAIWKALVGGSLISINMDGSTKGGIKGDQFRLTCINATTWQVTGVTNGTSTVATPFATS